MSDATISLLILTAVVVLFVWNRFPVELIAVGAALALYFTEVLTLNESRVLLFFAVSVGLVPLVWRF